jgi:hypothetical protein
MASKKKKLPSARHPNPRIRTQLSDLLQNIAGLQPTIKVRVFAGLCRRSLSRQLPRGAVERCILAAPRFYHGTLAVVEHDTELGTEDQLAQAAQPR